jgi:hypothetical protein
MEFLTNEIKYLENMNQNTEDIILKSLNLQAIDKFKKLLKQFEKTKQKPPKRCKECKFRESLTEPRRMSLCALLLSHIIIEWDIWHNSKRPSYCPFND